MRSTFGRLLSILATGTVVLLLCGTLCLFDEGGAGVDLCLIVLAIASTTIVWLTLEPTGRLGPALADAARCAPTEVRPPPPRG